MPGVFPLPLIFNQILFRWLLSFMFLWSIVPESSSLLSFNIFQLLIALTNDSMRFLELNVPDEIVLANYWQNIKRINGLQNEQLVILSQIWPVLALVYFYEERVNAFKVAGKLTPLCSLSCSYMYVRRKTSCGSSYIRQIGRNVVMCLKEHQKKMRLGQVDKSALAHHSWTTRQHTILFDDTAILARSSSYNSRIVREAI